jgi:hypothetical protein
MFLHPWRSWSENVYDPKRKMADFTKCAVDFVAGADLGGHLDTSSVEDDRF